MQRTAALLFFLSLAGAAASQVVINEAGIAPAGGAGSQFTELFNRSGCAVDLSCYTLVFSSTSGGGNATGWTIKIPSGKSIAAGGYFVIGGTAGTAGVGGSGTGYPTGGAANSFTGISDVNLGTLPMTANAVYMKQFLAAGSFPNTKGQLSLLDAAGNLVASVSYNSGNNAASYPLSAYTACNASGNTQGSNNVPDPGNATNNVSATFSAATNQGIYLTGSGTYATETSLTPGTSNAANGGTQICSGPVLNNATNAAVCFSTSNQTATLTYAATGAPATYSLTWTATASAYFTAVNNSALSGTINVIVPANTPAGVYIGFLTLTNACGNSCAKPFTLTVKALPTVNAGTYPPVCINSGPISLTGMPGGGAFSGTGVAANVFMPTATGNHVINYSYSDAATGCSNNASTVIVVSAPATAYTTACTNTTPYIFHGQPLATTGLHTVLLSNANGCTDTARLYLVVKQTTTVDTAACDSLFFNGTMYYNNASLTQIVSSVVTACDSLVKTIRIRIKKGSAKDTAVCLPANGSLTLLGQTFTANGNYVLHTTNSEGCDSAVRLHLTVAALQTQTHTGCDSVRLNGQSFYTSTAFSDTLRNKAGCDSVINLHNVFVNRTVHNNVNVCLGSGQTYSFNGQTIIASGQYTATFPRPGGCDSVVHLKLVIAQVQQQTVSGCNAVVYGGVTYTSSGVLRDTVRSTNSCDSLYRITQINVVPVKQTFVTACIKAGQSYNFNGQLLTATGLYTAIYQTTFCDSVVRLYLTVTQTNTRNLKGCDSVRFRGQTYFQSVVIRDTIRSAVSDCDSLITITSVVVHTIRHQFISVCLKEGHVYNFNGQLLNTTGNYQTTYATAYCDSVIHLYLVVSKQQNQRLTGCDSVRYKGVLYTASTVLTDTVKSLVSGCDSLIHFVVVTVNKKPLIAVSHDTTICKGDTVKLNASSPSANLNWTGFGNAASIVVSPQSTTTYFVAATDTNGCLNKASVIVAVQDFSLLLSADKNPSPSGTTVALQTSGNLFYAVTSWQPSVLFVNQTAKSQRFVVDTSVNITVRAQTIIGCRDSASLQLIAIPLDDVYIPSGFTPNGDGRNDEVRVVGTAIEEMDFKIFNRWGQTVFYTNDKSKGWNGKVAGMLQPVGIYVYFVKVKKYNGQVVVKKGTVTLIR